MKKMSIYEPAMCCSTGLCGVGVDPELLRISTNLSSSPQEFVNNKEVNNFINTKGIDELPITVLDGEIVIAGRYPTNEEFKNLLGVSVNISGEQPKAVKTTLKKSNSCGCSGGKCC